MPKPYFHQHRSLSEDIIENKSTPLEYVEKKRIVDINKLLNRVKENEKNELVKKITLLSIGVIVLSVFGIITIL